MQAAPAVAVTAGALIAVPHNHTTAPARPAAAAEAAYVTRTAPAAAASRTYVVRPGDTLSGISAESYGTPVDWPGLYQANRSVVSSPNLIYPGETLTVPAAPATSPAPAPAATQSTTGAAEPAAPGVPASFQSCVITRESGGNPTAVNPSSGAGGLFQFLPSTWHDLGFSGLPEDASVQTQFEAFAKLYAQAGVSPWRPSDGCT